MIKRHLIVVKKIDGTPEVQPMKEWLRQNPSNIPEGLDASDNTSYQLRRALRKIGWELEELPDRVLLIKPDENNDTSYADSALSENADMEDGYDAEEIIEAAEITFGLERDLQVALRAKIDQLEPGLKISDGGKEKTTEAGRIDITAIDSQNNTVIIELKAGVAQPESVTQLLAYMGSVSVNDRKLVRGILVAGDFHKKVILASRAIPNLQLKKYSFQFTFESVG